MGLKGGTDRRMGGRLANIDFINGDDVEDFCFYSENKKKKKRKKGKGKKVRLLRFSFPLLLLLFFAKSSIIAPINFMCPRRSKDVSGERCNMEIMRRGIDRSRH